MRQRTTGQIWVARFSAALIAMVLAPSLAWAQGMPKALDPQPSEDQLQAGLSVKYYYDNYRTIRGLEKKIAALGRNGASSSRPKAIRASRRTWPRPQS